MKLKSLRANHDSFHTVNFKEGVNVIVGKQISPKSENDGKTYNGVGKSFIIHLIHFCLGSNKIESFTKNLPDWEFTLEFEVDEKEYFATRSTNDQSKINFCGKNLSLTEMKNKMLELCFGISEPPKNMTWITLFSRFIRRYRTSYSRYDTYVTKESDYSKILNNLFLLGIDKDLIVEKKELREKQVDTQKTEKAIKKDDFFKQYYLGENDPEIDLADLESKIKELEEDISEFNVSSNYHELEIEANKKSYLKKSLENERVLISNYINNIEETIKETTGVNEDDVIKVYESAKIEIPDMIRKKIDEVLEFHKKQISSRNYRLRKELRKQEEKLEEIDNKISDIGESMDELLKYLDSHGALEEYVALTKQLSSFKNDASRIEEYQDILKSYRKENLNTKSSMIKLDQEADEYLENIKSLTDDLIADFRKYAKKFYPNKRSGLVINNNTGENKLRFTMDARIEDDSSDGVNEVRLFCFDLLLLLFKKGKIRFLFHDSRLFANMDPRQREILMRIVYDVTLDNEFQYICSMNEDTILSFKDLMTDEEYTEIIKNNIILELNDDSSESKLLGIQVDIDLEDKNKTNVSMK